MVTKDIIQTRLLQRIFNNKGVSHHQISFGLKGVWEIYQHFQLGGGMFDLVTT